MKRTQEGKQKKVAAAALGKAPGNVQRMNGKQRRELARKIQADDVSLEVVHPEESTSVTSAITWRCHPSGIRSTRCGDSGA